MSATTKIEWTDRTWNPVRGCSLVSAGCANCYAMKQAHRFSKKGQPYAGLTEIGPHGPRWTGKIMLVPDALSEPLTWKKPCRVFVNSMSDLFHEDVPDEFIEQVFGIMASCERHTFQVLTKRPKRMYDWMQDRHPWGIHPPIVYGEVGWPPKNVWLGVSVENQATADERIQLLLQTPAAVRFVSAEPLIGSVDMRRYLGDERRTGISRTDSSGVVLSSSGRNDLEACRVQRRGNASASICGSETGGMQRVGDGRLSEDTIPRPGREEAGRGTSNCLDGNEQSGHSAGHGDQSRGRYQVSQSSIESDADDQTGERQACLSSAGTQTESAGRDGQCVGESNRAAGDGDPCSVGPQGFISTPNSREVRNNPKRSICNSDTEELGSFGLSWVIVGGESGPGARPCDVAWIRSIKQQCQNAAVPVFVKQLGRYVVDRNDAGFEGDGSNSMADGYGCK